MFKKIAAVCDESLEFRHLFFEFINLQMCETLELHIDDCLCLNVIKSESLFKIGLGILGVTACTYDFDYFIDIVNRNNQCFQNVCAFKCLA